MTTSPRAEPAAAFPPLAVVLPILLFPPVLPENAPRCTARPPGGSEPLSKLHLGPTREPAARKHPCDTKQLDTLPSCSPTPPAAHRDLGNVGP